MAYMGFTAKINSAVNSQGQGAWLFCVHNSLCIFFPLHWSNFPFLISDGLPSPSSPFSLSLCVHLVSQHSLLILGTMASSVSSSRGSQTESGRAITPRYAENGFFLLPYPLLSCNAIQYRATVVDWMASHTLCTSLTSTSPPSPTSPRLPSPLLTTSSCFQDDDSLVASLLESYGHALDERNTSLAVEDSLFPVLEVDFPHDKATKETVKV